MPSFDQLGTLWRGLTRRQQIVIVGGSVLFGVTLWIFVQLLGKDDYKPLYSGLAAGEAQAIAQRLDAQKIPYEIPGDGASIRVPSSKLDAIRLDMASQGLPQSGRLGFELFDQPNWVGSDFAERVNYQRALEGELERTIQTVGGVEAVRVHLVLSRESLFSEREQLAKASVVLKLRGGRLPDDSIVAITHLVASSVDGLQPENVSVVDADGRVPLLVSNQPRQPGIGTPSNELEAKLVAALTPVVGDGRVKASVTVDYVLGTTEMTNESFDPNQTVVLTSQLSEERMQGAGAVGIPGTSSNTPVAKPAPESAAADATKTAENSGAPPVSPTTTPDEAQYHRTENKTFAVTRTIKHSVEPAGTIRRIAAAVLVDDGITETEADGQKVTKRRKRTSEEMQRIQAVAAAAIGIDPTRGDKLAVENFSFEGIPSDQVPTPPSGLQRFVPMLERWTGALRYVALLALFGIVYFFVLRPVKKQMVTAFRELPGRVGAGQGQGAALSSGSGGAANLAAGGGFELQPGTSSNIAVDPQRALKLKQQLVNTVKKEPREASSVVQSWIGQRLRRMMTSVAAPMSGARKAAILLVLLGEEAATTICQHLSPDALQRVVREIRSLGQISPDLVAPVLEEYYQLLADGQSGASQGGADFAKRVVTKAFGEERARDFLANLSEEESASFEFLQKADPQQLANFMEGEHPQTVALILAHLGANAAPAVALLPEAVRADAMKRLAGLNQFSMETVRTILLVLNRKLGSIRTNDRCAYGGARAVADLLNKVDANTSKAVLESIEREDPKQAVDIRNLMFTFEDLVTIPENGIREMLSQLDKKTLAVALKGASEDVKNHIFKSMSSRAVDMLKEDMDALGPVRVRDAEQAKQDAVAIIRKLETDGKVSLKAAGDEYVV